MDLVSLPVLNFLATQLLPHFQQLLTRFSGLSKHIKKKYFNLKCHAFNYAPFCFWLSGSHKPWPICAPLHTHTWSHFIIKEISNQLWTADVPMATSDTCTCYSGMHIMKPCTPPYIQVSPKIPSCACVCACVTVNASNTERPRSASLVYRVVGGFALKQPLDVPWLRCRMYRASCEKITATYRESFTLENLMALQ